MDTAHIDAHRHSIRNRDEILRLAPSAAASTVAERFLRQTSQIGSKMARVNPNRRHFARSAGSRLGHRIKIPDTQSTWTLLRPHENALVLTLVLVRSRSGRTKRRAPEPPIRSSNGCVNSARPPATLLVIWPTNTRHVWRHKMRHNRKVVLATSLVLFAAFTVAFGGSPERNAKATHTICTPRRDHN